MWRKPPFSIADNDALDARNLAVVRERYKERLGFQEARTEREEDSGRPFKDLCVSGDNTLLSLLELEPGAAAENRHVVFFARNLEKAQQWLAGRGVAVEPTATDSGGNRFFRFQDLDGSTLVRRTAIARGQRTRARVCRLCTY
jgi:hypothetical protein